MQDKKKKKTDVKFCFLLLCKFHRPFVGNLSPRTTKEDKTRVWDLWQPEYSFQKHHHQIVITKWWVSGVLIEAKMSPGCPKALKAIQIVSSFLKKFLCKLRHQILTPFCTVAQSWNNFLSASMFSFYTIVKKRIQAWSYGYWDEK